MTLFNLQSRIAVVSLVSVLSMSSVHGQPRSGKRGKKSEKRGTKQIDVPTPKQAHKEVSLSDAEPTIVELGLAEVLQSAVAHSPRITRAQLDTSDSRIEVTKREARFDRVLNATINNRLERTFNVNAVNEQDPLRLINTATAEVGISSPLKSGGQYTISADTTLLAERNPPDFFRPLSPMYTNQIRATLTHPLARGRGYAANEGQIDQAKLQAELDKAESHELLRQVALQASSAYWALVLRREELSILEANVQDATTLLEIVRRRVRGGQDPQSSIVESEASIAERRQSVEAAKVAVVNAERQLLSDAFLVQSNTVKFSEIPVPTEKLTEDLASFIPNLEKDIETALTNRPEVTRVAQELRSARLNYQIAQDALRPRFDLYAEAGLRGVAGKDRVPGTDEATALVSGGFGKSLSNLASIKAPYAEVGIIIQVPLGNRAAKSNVAQAKLAIERAKANNVRSEIALDIRAAYQRLQIAKSNLSTALESLSLAEKLVTATKLRYKGGGATLFDVTRSQDGVTRARARIALAKAQIAVAKIDLEAARGTLVKTYNLVPSPRKQDSK